MTVMRRLFIGLFLVSTAVGFHGSAAFASCPMVQAPRCCCENSAAIKSDCCPVQKAANCPTLKKTEPVSAAVLPRETQVSPVVMVTSIANSAEKPFFHFDRAFMPHGLSPPSPLAFHPTSLRAPPAVLA